MRRAPRILGMVLVIGWALASMGSGADRPPVTAAELQQAIDRAPHGATVTLGASSIHVATPLRIVGKDIVLTGTGEASLLWTDRPIPILFKEGSGTFLSLDRIRFDAQVRGARGVECAAPSPTLIQRQELVVTACTFTGLGAGIVLNNVREPLITATRFTVGETAVLLRDVSNGAITGCFFSPIVEQQGTRGIHYDGDPGSPFAAGLRIIGCTLMGLSTGVEISGTDFLSMMGNIVDYCDLPLLLADQDGASVQGNYFGARGSRQSGRAVGVEIRGGVHTSQHVLLQGNTIVTAPETGVPGTGVRARGVHGLRIVDNTIHFWTEAGVDHDSCTRASIEGNTILGSPAATGPAVIRPTSGTALIARGVRSVTIPHGLGIKPARVWATPEVPAACGTTATELLLTVTLVRALDHDVRVFWRVED